MRFSPRSWLLLLVACALLLSAPALTWPLMPDEAGFLLVSHQWEPGPGTLYGELWVDRPPVLIATYAAADALLGTYGVRAVVVLLTVAAVLAAHRLGTLIGGPAAARCSGAVAVILTGWPSLATSAGKSESLGVPLVIVGCWLIVEATRRASLRAASALALLAGVSASLAVGMKQNLVSAVVFIAVLVVARVVVDADHRGRALLVAAASIVGGVLPVVAVLAWGAAVGVTPVVMWDVLFTFRSDAIEVIAAYESQANRERALRLAGLAVGSGVAVLLGWFLLRLPAILRTRPAGTRVVATRIVALATTAVLALATVGMVLSGSYWAPYLQAMTPACVLATALLVGVGGRTARVTRVGVGLMVLPLLVSLAVDLVPRSSQSTVTGTHAGRAVGTVSQAGDSIVVLYGNPHIVHSSGLDPAYRHLWSLPLRTLDPDLTGLRSVVTGPDAPTWIVTTGAVSAWRLDADGQLREAIGERYTRHGAVCGNEVWRLSHVERADLPRVDCESPPGPWG